ncbi:MAG: hypothetical protein ABSB86_06495 [Bryobacteraceae bacterium]
MKGPLERLAAAGIQVIPADLGKHFIVERDGFVAFIQRGDNDFGHIGASGLMTDRGFAALVWRGNQAFFVGKGFEQPADETQVQKIRAFSSDLERAVSGHE